MYDDLKKEKLATNRIVLLSNIATYGTIGLIIIITAAFVLTQTNPQVEKAISELLRSKTGKPSTTAF